MQQQQQQQQQQQEQHQQQQQEQHHQQQQQHRQQHQQYLPAVNSINNEPWISIEQSTPTTTTPTTQQQQHQQFQQQGEEQKDQKQLESLLAEKLQQLSTMEHEEQLALRSLAQREMRIAASEAEAAGLRREVSEWTSRVEHQQQQQQQEKQQQQQQQQQQRLEMQRQLCRQVRVTQERAEERELHDLQLHRAALEERLQQQALGLSELRSEASAGAGATAADTGERHSGESRSPASLAACSAELLRLVARKQSDLAQGAAERSQLESEAQQRAEQLAELELELDRQERRLQRLAAQRRQQEAQAEAVQSCEARIASLSEQYVRAEASRSQDLQHSQGNSVADDLAVALRELLGFA
ncbi:unnamed protein product [Polarella glacialis]|uniref:Uncharacterized protein n=1 Tax=Polarella glacialis TaxID=89957 RepID=A0A813ETR7_POLGL|nr:unnamed protein product [Polarella glacialis]